MRALVTGGAGFIGSHTVEALLARGDAVTVLDDLSTGRQGNLEAVARQPAFRFVHGSVIDADLVRDLTAEADVIFHFAAAVGVRTVLSQPLRSLMTNLEGTRAVLEAALPRRTPVLFASTSEVYGKNALPSLSETDDSILGPTTTTRWLYAASKAVDEFLALAHHAEHGLPVVIVRYFNVYGPRQAGAYGMVIPRLIGQALRGEPLTVHGDGLQTRCFTYIADAVRATLALVDTPAATGNVVNIGAPREVSILHLAEEIIRQTGSASKVQRVPYSVVYPKGFEDMRLRVPNVTRLRDLIGYAPDTPLEAGLRETIAYIRQTMERV